MNHSEVAHRWAHGKSANGCNMRSDGTRLWSYRTVIGERVEYKGEELYLLNQTGYSNSTAKHQGHMRRAVPHGATVFTVDGYGRGVDRLAPYGAETRENPARAWRAFGAGLIKGYLEKAATAQSAASRRRKDSVKVIYLETAARYMIAAQDANKFFGCRRKIPADLSGLVAAMERVKKAAAAEIRAEAKRREAAQAEALADWLRGERCSAPYNPEKIFFRVVERGNGNGKEIETSRGAFIPYEDGRKAFVFAIARREKGWKRNEETFPVGDYQIDCINAAGVIAGCHKMRWPEIDAFAAAQGWIDGKGE